MNDYSQLLGFILPPIVSLVNKHIKSETGQVLIAYLISLAVAIVIKAKDIDFSSPVSVLNTCNMIFVESQFTFYLVYQNGKVQSKIEAIPASQTNQG